MDVREILLCTDSESIHAALSEVLREAGFEVTHASTGGQVLEESRLHDFPVALLDLDAPEVKGAALLLELRQIRPAMETVFMTTAIDESIWRDLMHGGAFDLLPKPFDEGRLLKSLRGAAIRRQVHVKKEQLLEELLEREKSLGEELALRDEEIKNLKTGAGVERAMEARIHLLEEERDRLRDTLVGKRGERGGGEEGEGEEGKEEEEEIARMGDPLKIRYPHRAFSIFNIFFLGGAFFFAFAAVFYTGAHFPGQSERARLCLRSALLLMALIWLEGGLLIKLYSVLGYFRLNPLVDEFVERARLRERIYGVLGTLLVLGALLAYGSSLKILRSFLLGCNAPSLFQTLTRFSETTQFHGYHFHMLATAILAALALLFLVLRLNLRYHENLEQHLQRTRTRSLLDRF